MTLRLRAGLTTLVAVLLIALVPRGAQAQEEPSVSVTPSTGLADGQVVSVTGTGFDPGASRWAGTICLREVLDLPPSEVAQINAICGAESVVELTPNPAGEFSTSMVAHQVQRTFTGGTIDCGLSGCVITFVQVGPAGNLTGSAAAAIRFGPPAPQTKGACKNGGWRGLADDQGQPFRNQGQCVSYVVARRH